MRKQILFLLITLINVTAFAQDKGYRIGLWGAVDQHPIVQANKQLSNGLKYVSSSPFLPNQKNSSIKDNTECNISIGLSVSRASDNLPQYELYIETVTNRWNSLYIYKDSPLLIKLNNGEVIKLYCAEDVEDRIGRIVSITYDITNYTVVPRYPISSTDIAKLKDGIKKVRLEVNAQKYDLEFKKYKKDELGDFLYKAKGVITDALMEQTGFDADF